MSDIRQVVDRFVIYGPPKAVDTPAGRRLLRVAEATPKFWAFFAGRTEDFRQEGLTIREHKGQWQVREWSLLDGTVPPPTLKLEGGLTVLPRDIERLLLPWQPPGVINLLRAMRRWGFALDCSDAGIGKTAVACAVARMLELQPMVVCQKYARAQWAWMAQRFGIAGQFHHWEVVRMGKTDLGHVDKVTRYSPKLKLKSEHRIFRWTLPEKSLLVVDEIHNAGGLNTLNSLLVIGAKDQQIPTLGLSATVADTPVRMRAIGYLTGLFNDPQLFYPWANRMGCKRGSRGGMVFDADEHPDTLPAIHQALFHTGKAIRIRKSDIPNFPKVQVFVEAIDCAGASGRINAHYRSIERAIDLYRQKQMRRIDLENNATIERQLIELLKIGAVEEMVNDLVIDGWAVVVFVNYRQTAIELAKVLRCPLIIGEQKEEEREAAMREFQEDRSRKLVSTYGAGRESINLQDEHGYAPRQALLFPAHSSTHLRQAANRIHRATSKSGAIQRFIFAAGTIEERTMERAREKLMRLDTLQDGEAEPLPLPTPIVQP